MGATAGVATAGVATCTIFIRQEERYIIYAQIEVWTLVPVMEHITSLRIDI